MNASLPALAGILALTQVAVASAADLTVRSENFVSGATLAPAQTYDGFGCTGANISPQLAWDKVPAGTKSFAVTAYDPDAPTGSGWWHWVVYNIPSNVQRLDEGAGVPGGVKLPSGARPGRNDFGTYAYGGACPPAGARAHNYVFTVYALKVEKLDVTRDASAALIGYMIHSNKIGMGTLTARYGR